MQWGDFEKCYLYFSNFISFYNNMIIVITFYINNYKMIYIPVI